MPPPSLAHTQLQDAHSFELPWSFLQVEAEVVDDVTIKYNVASVPTFVFLQVCYHAHVTGVLLCLTTHSFMERYTHV